MFFNKIVISIFLAWFVCQGVLKTITRSIRKKRFYWKAVFEGGGMPSGHAALVTAMSTAAGMVSGFDSMIFYITLGFSALVIHETLVTKKAIVQIVQLLSPGGNHEHITEKLGHTILEIVVGAVIAWAIVYTGLAYF